MKLIFCIFEYFPYGGVQRDMLKIATRCLDRGHSVHVLTMAWKGEKPAELEVRELPVHSFSNYARCRDFSEEVGNLVSNMDHDLVIGFNKMAGLDIYFSADPCYRFKVLKEKPGFYRLVPRYRIYQQLEAAVFSRESKTLVLLLSPQEKNRYIECYGTASERFFILPPGISKEYFRTENYFAIRNGVRGELDLADNHHLLLMVGSSFDTKGVDRSIRAMASLSSEAKQNTWLYIIGQGKPAAFKKLADHLGVGGHVFFLGARDDVPRYLFAADLLLHPARSENTGTVLIEAMASGLPVLVTANCGYAFHVHEAGAGRLVPSPFDQKIFNQSLANLLEDKDIYRMGENGLEYTLNSDVTSLHERAVEIIERVGAERKVLN